MSSHLQFEADSHPSDVRRFWPLAVLTVGVGVFLVGVGSLLYGCSSDAFCNADRGLAIGRMVALTSGMLFGVALVVLGLKPRGRRVGRRTLACLAACSLAAGLAASTPVMVGWNDGCNHHAALVPVLLYPAVWWKPDRFPGAYADFSTLRLCS